MNIPQRYKRELITITFSKSGVQQEWKLHFNNNRLLTDEAFTSYQKTVYLRSVEKCKTLEDVLQFLTEYAFDKRSVKILRMQNSDEHQHNLNLIKIINIKIDFSKVKGSVYFGRHTITFNNNIVSFLIKNTIDDGTYLITGKYDLLKLTNKILGNLQSDVNFLTAVKRLETH